MDALAKDLLFNAVFHNALEYKHIQENNMVEEYKKWLENHKEYNFE